MTRKRIPHEIRHLNWKTDCKYLKTLWKTVLLRWVLGFLPKFLLFVTAFSTNPMRQEIKFPKLELRCERSSVFNLTNCFLYEKKTANLTNPCIPSFFWFSCFFPIGLKCLAWISFSSYASPDRTFHNFLASKFANSLILFREETSIHGFWSSLIVKCYFGQLLLMKQLLT